MNPAARATGMENLAVLGVGHKGRCDPDQGGVLREVPRIGTGTVPGDHAEEAATFHPYGATGFTLHGARVQQHVVGVVLVEGCAVDVRGGLGAEHAHLSAVFWDVVLYGVAAVRVSIDRNGGGSGIVEADVTKVVVDVLEVSEGDVLLVVAACPLPGTNFFEFGGATGAHVHEHFGAGGVVAAAVAGGVAHLQGFVHKSEGAGGVPA